MIGVFYKNIMKNKLSWLIVILILMFSLSFFTACDNDSVDAEVRVSFNITSLELQVGQSETIVGTTSPEEYRNQLNWVISDSSIATIHRAIGPSVIVNAIAEGTVTITVTLPNTNINETIIVSVSLAPVIPVTGIVMIADDPIEVEFNAAAGARTVAVSVNVQPVNATNQTVVWTVYPEGIIGITRVDHRTVNVGGQEAGIGLTATLTVTTEDGNFSVSRLVMVAAVEE